MNTKEKGDFGERAVCDYIKEKGFRIIKRNYHIRGGEIDIIAKDGNCIVFIEVKTRKNSFFAKPCEYVDYKKRNRIIKTARWFLGENIDNEVRFDVAEVYYSENDDKILVNEINYIKNAFICE